MTALRVISLIGAVLLLAGCGADGEPETPTKQATANSAIFHSIVN